MKLQREKERLLAIALKKQQQVQTQIKQLQEQVEKVKRQKEDGKRKGDDRGIARYEATTRRPRFEFKPSNYDYGQYDYYTKQS